MKPIITFDAKDFLKSLGKISVAMDREIRREVKRSAEMVKNNLRREYKPHVVTGKLRSSPVVESDDGFKSAVVGSNEKHAVFIEFGTEPHFIAPKKAKTLAFFWPKIGNYIFPRWVVHPGTKAYLCLTKAWLDAMYPAEKFYKRLKTRIDRLVQ